MDLLFPQGVALTCFPRQDENFMADAPLTERVSTWFLVHSFFRWGAAPAKAIPKFVCQSSAQESQCPSDGHLTGTQY